MIRAFEVSKDENLLEYGRLLWQRKISHIIQEAGDVQIVAVADASQVEEALRLYGQWQSGEIKPSENDSADVGSWFRGAGSGKGLYAAFFQTPLTFSLIILCSILFIFTEILANRQLMNSLLFPSFARGGTLYLEQIVSDMTLNQFVRMFTPSILHGGTGIVWMNYMHIIFNMLWLWELGRCIETKQKSWQLALVILFVSLVSNWSQYIMMGGSQFVGMSGVITGLLGYILLWKLVYPQRGISMPSPILMFLLFFIIVIAVVDTFLNYSVGMSFIADTAHIAGLIAGALVGLLTAFISRLRSRQ
jgi:GlpG protein